MSGTLSDATKIALAQAENSSQRCRWIVFILQITAILVVIASWHQSDLHWSTLRLRTAQNAVWVLCCDPARFYDQTVATSPANASIVNPNLSPAPRRAPQPSVTPETLEARDWSYRCSRPISAKEELQAIDYLKQWNYSLADAERNVAELQQQMNTRIIQLTIPVLGLAIDINDLSVMAGLAFSILISWFHFSLRRQYENIRQLFDRARRSGELADAYDLLVMTQVLTLPPTALSQVRPPSLVQHLRRLPNLIMCTAAAAQGIVIANDFISMKHGNTLSPVISWFETISAVVLFAYIVIRTVQCFQLMGVTYSEWGLAYRDITASKSAEALIRVAVDVPTPSVTQD